MCYFSSFAARSFALLVQGNMSRSDDPNDYVVHDPLLEKGKEKFNRMQAKQKRREREWAGKSLTWPCPYQAWLSTLPSWEMRKIMKWRGVWLADPFTSSYFKQFLKFFDHYNSHGAVRSTMQFICLLLPPANARDLSFSLSLSLWLELNRLHIFVVGGSSDWPIAFGCSYACYWDPS